MSRSGGSRTWSCPHTCAPPPVRQGDAYFSQPNPVSTTLYEWRDEVTGALLGTQRNVRIIGVAVRTTGGTVSLLEVVVTVDGIPDLYRIADPVSGTWYVTVRSLNQASNNQLLLSYAGTSTEQMRAFFEESRSIKIEVRVTWTVQPSPLVLRVKWAKYLP